MIPRYLSDIESAYQTQFPDANTTLYMEACTFKEYEELLKLAMDRKKEVILEELIEVAGEDAYLERKAYLEAWGIADA